jgi:hypothetical protein
VAEVGDIYDSPEEMKQLAAIFERRYQVMLRLINVAVGRAFGIQNFRITDSEVNRILVDAGHRIVRIDEYTRMLIAEQLRLGQELGFSNWQIAHGVPEVGYHGVDGLYKETWRGRAEMIARTELQHAQNEATLNRYRATGLVDEVTIIDGDDDEPCRSRNGTVVPITDHPQLAHPNCTLGLIPVVREGAA